VIRLLCVGLGGMGHHDWNAALDSGGFVAVAGVDLQEEARQVFAAKTGYNRSIGERPRPISSLREMSRRWSSPPAAMAWAVWVICSRGRVMRLMSSKSSAPTSATKIVVMSAIWRLRLSRLALGSAQADNGRAQYFAVDVDLVLEQHITLYFAQGPPPQVGEHLL